jgi:hypothetical protein
MKRKLVGSVPKEKRYSGLVVRIASTLRCGEDAARVSCTEPNRTEPSRAQLNAGLFSWKPFHRCAVRAWHRVVRER